MLNAWWYQTIKFHAVQVPQFWEIALCSLCYITKRYWHNVSLQNINSYLKNGFHSSDIFEILVMFKRFICYIYNICFEKYVIALDLLFEKLQLFLHLMWEFSKSE